MGVVTGLLMTPGAEAPDSIVCGDAMGQTDVHQGLQVAVQGNAVNMGAVVFFETLLHLGMAEGLSGCQQGFQECNPESGNALTRFP